MYKTMTLISTHKVGLEIVVISSSNIESDTMYIPIQYKHHNKDSEFSDEIVNSPNVW